MVSSILPKNEQNSLSWASSLLRIVSFFEIIWPLALNIKSFSQSIRQVFLAVGQNNFGNKIPFFLCEKGSSENSEERKCSPRNSSYFDVQSRSEFEPTEQTHHVIYVNPTYNAMHRIYVRTVSSLHLFSDFLELI
jgi:hypothetical protein